MKRAQRRIMVRAMLGILMTGALVGASTAWPLFQSHREQLEAAALGSAVAQAELLERLLAGYRDTASQVSRQTGQRAPLMRFADGELDRAALVAVTRPYLAEAMRGASNIIGLVRRDALGQVLVSIGPAPGRQARDGASAATLQLVPLEGGVALEVAVEILAADQERLGTDVFYFRLDQLAAVLAEEEFFGPGAQLWLAGPPAGTLVHSDDASGVMVVDRARLPVGSAELLATDTPHLQRHGDQVLVHAPLASAGWGVLVAMPASTFYGPLYSELRWPLVTILLLMGLGAMLTVRTLRPLLNHLTEQTGRLHFSAHFDPLTGLPNRAHLLKRLSTALKKADEDGEGLAVLFLDLDHFKGINDSLGHALGDRLLQAVGQRLQRVLRDEDALGRLGGDEFLVLLDQLHESADAGRVAEKLIAALVQPFDVGQHEIFIGASVGISLYPQDGHTAEALIQHADTAMYAAKALKRNTWQYFTPELGEASRERFHVDVGLRRALERDELVLHYQPQAWVEGGRVFGAEALVRWTTPEGDVVRPGQFIALAEEAGLIHAIGRWVLKTACRQAREWELRGLPWRVSVNLSGLQVVQGDIVADVRTALHDSALTPSRLELEITEGFVIGHAEEGLERLHGLRGLGIELAVDDFGTGYSSLGYLKRLPVQCLKIDQSFVADVPGDPDDETLVAAILSLAERLGLDVIAEGVERAEQLEFLRTLGCLHYQGDYLSPPLPADAFEARWGNGDTREER